MNVEITRQEEIGYIIYAVVTAFITLYLLVNFIVRRIQNHEIVKHGCYTKQESMRNVRCRIWAICCWMSASILNSLMSAGYNLAMLIPIGLACLAFGMAYLIEDHLLKQAQKVYKLKQQEGG